MGGRGLFSGMVALKTDAAAGFCGVELLDLKTKNKPAPMAMRTTTAQNFFIR